MSPKQHATAVIRFARKISGDFLKDYPENKFTFQTSPADNHAMWVLGHLALTDSWIAGVVGAKGTTSPDGWDNLFGSGSKPVDDPRKYPPVAEVKKVFDANRAALLNWFEAAADKDLALQLSEKTGGFMTDPVDGMLKMAWHEGWHMGQVATLRKALGLPSVMG